MTAKIAFTVAIAFIALSHPAQSSNVGVVPSPRDAQPRATSANPTTTLVTADAPLVFKITTKS